MRCQSGRLPGPLGERGTGGCSDPGAAGGSGACVSSPPTGGSAPTGVLNCAEEGAQLVVVLAPRFRFEPGRGVDQLRGMAADHLRHVVGADAAGQPQRPRTVTRRPPCQQFFRDPLAGAAAGGRRVSVQQHARAAVAGLGLQVRRCAHAQRLVVGKGDAVALVRLLVAVQLQRVQKSVAQQRQRLGHVVHHHAHLQQRQIGQRANRLRAGAARRRGQDEPEQVGAQRHRQLRVGPVGDAAYLYQWAPTAGQPVARREHSRPEPVPRTRRRRSGSGSSNVRACAGARANNGHGAIGGTRARVCGRARVCLGARPCRAACA